MRLSNSPLACTLVLLLAGCGGGEEEPRPSGRSASLTVSAASDTSLNGLYTTSDVELGDVILDRDEDGEVCFFHFAGLPQEDGNLEMEGTVRYAATTSGSAGGRLLSTEVFIDGSAYRLEGTANAGLELDEDRVRYTGALLISPAQTTRTLALTGELPMRGDRPRGC